MKALSLWQPHASLVEHGVKTNETRSWRPPAGLVGQRIAIHAAKKVVKFDEIPVAVHKAAELALGCGWSEEDIPNRGASWSQVAPRGVVVATATLWSAFQVSGHSEVLGKRYAYNGLRFVEIDPYGDFAPGRWIWQFEDIEPLAKPVKATGRQGLWNWTPPDGVCENIPAACMIPGMEVQNA